MRDDLEPGGLLGGDLGLLHPSPTLGVGPSRDLARRGVAGQAEGVVEVAPPEVLQGHPDLLAGDGVEHVGRRLDRLDLDGGLGPGRDRLDQAVQVGRVETQAVGLLAEQGPVARRVRPPLAARSRTRRCSSSSARSRSARWAAASSAS